MINKRVQYVTYEKGEQFISYGRLLAFGISSEDVAEKFNSEFIPAHYSTGIIETENGQLVNIPVTCITILKEKIGMWTVEK